MGSRDLAAAGAVSSIKGFLRRMPDEPGLRPSPTTSFRPVRVIGISADSVTTMIPERG